MTSKRRRQLRIKQLSTSLLHACEALDSEKEFLKPLFDASVIERLIEHSTNESREVTLRRHPHEFSLCRCIKYNEELQLVLIKN